MAELILSIINEGLPIIDKLVPDQATIIRNRILNLRGKWDAEFSKSADTIDDALLDEYTRELLDIGSIFSASLKQASSKS
jgi:hypothetical protein